MYPIPLREFIALAHPFGVRVAETRADPPHRFLIRPTEFGDFYAVPDPWDEDMPLDSDAVRALCLDLGVIPGDFDEDLDRLA